MATKADVSAALDAIKADDPDHPLMKPVKDGPSEMFTVRVFVRAVADLSVWTARRAYTTTEYENYLTWIVGRRGIEDVMPWARRFMVEVFKPYDVADTLAPSVELVGQMADRFVANECSEATWFELVDAFILIAAGREVRDLERERRLKLKAGREQHALKDSETETDIDAKLRAITEAERGRIGES